MTTLAWIGGFACVVFLLAAGVCCWAAYYVAKIEAYREGIED